MQRLKMVWDAANDALEQGSCRGTAFDALVPTLKLNTPVPTPIIARLPEMATRARELLLAGSTPDFPGQPLPDRVMGIQLLVREGLLQAVEASGEAGDRLYVLEFQGARQYVMFGHTTAPASRLAEHMRSATPHGYALLAGWFSPPLVPNASKAERVLLLTGGEIHGHEHYRERFYDMPYERGLNLVRCIFEDFQATSASGRSRGRNLRSMSVVH